MGVLKFSDGVEIDTSGDYRVLTLKDGLYVTGFGVLIPVETHKEAIEEIIRLRGGILQMETVTIKIAKDGKPEISVNGVKGPNCKELSKEIEKALGSVASDKPTGEMYEQAETAQHKNLF